MSNLKKTLLYDRHLSAKGRMGPVFSFQLPWEYPAGREQEYWATRRSVTVSDVDFMVRLRLCGPEALNCLQMALTGDLSKLKAGAMKYALLARDNGRLLDSVTVVRLAGKEYWLIADSVEVEGHLRAVAGNRELVINDVSEESFMLSIQGPKSAEVMRRLLGFDVSFMPPAQVLPFNLDGRRGWVERFGFTGEGGFELMVEPQEAGWFWDRSLEEGAEPCAYLASEDLRIGAGFVSLDKENGNPFENRLGRMVDFGKGDFVGRAALLKTVRDGMEKVLVWFLAEKEEIVSADGGLLEIGGVSVGRVSSSGIFWPGKRLLAMAYVKPEYAFEGVACKIRLANEQEIAGRLFNKAPRNCPPGNKETNRKFFQTDCPALRLSAEKTPK